MFVQGKLTASTVGQIVGLQSEEIKQIASEYAEKVSNNRTANSVGRSNVLLFSTDQC